MYYSEDLAVKNETKSKRGRSKQKLFFFIKYQFID